ncbi:MAG: SpoIIE family protein phosphatase [Bryobacteraceae bacterium]
MTKHGILYRLPVVRDRSNLPLGVFPDTQYDQERIPLHAGDRVLLYTDGVLESEDPAGNQFGERCLLATLEKHQTEELSVLNIT